MSQKNRILLYLVITLSISYLYQVFITVVAPDIASEKFSNLALILMYFPGVIAIVFTSIFKEGWSNLGLKIRRPIFWLYSLVIPLIITILLLVFIQLLGGEQKVFSMQGYNVSFLDKTPVSLVTFIPLFSLNFTVTACLTGIFTIGEELGWRGYLQNKMIQVFGLIPGVVILGLVWGYWHLPIILMGYNFPEYPILGALIFMPLTTIGFSLIFAWLTLSSKSIWPAVLGHGAINTLLSDSVIDRIEVPEKILLYLLIVGLWLIAGIIAGIKLNSDYKSGKIQNLSFR
ncbi:type II CAAX endopeptidase family protein [Nodularia sp. UHCC 0506]|uniref:CPBP family intramembrane glutamic endopeptidase n=1 Tax=Nodularia sp. UHCC 0506 TaxID=3110243 RepID=UPI002B1F7067|nr:type II CAAX endopeptidase family protein [Nodularia sp. UHCC 0506]MEA5515386.1 type II CAAX endopeptidase family protein [Nodularia sp. UHCC 0506]